ncbi:MAG: ketopantoate reductase family protein [Eubacteriales bacterium]|nr:ketopantoate reductase family protein [Eubacteriales bacterium]
MSTMREIRTAAIIGLGNLGIAFGNHLSKKMPKGDLRFIADRERIDRYERDGIFCNGERCDFQYVTPEEDTWPADLVLFTVKFHNLVEAIDAAKNHVGENTILLSALNGITSEGMLEEAFGADKVLYCVAQGMDGIKTGNRLTFDHMGMLCFGDREAGTVSDQVRMVEAFFQKTEFPHEVETDMMKRLWGKLMLNVGVNQTASVYLCDYGGLQQEGEARETMIAAMREVIPLSEREGFPLTEADLAYWLKVLATLRPEGKPSMQQDMEAGLTTEVELFSGTVLALGRKYGIETPVNERLYHAIASRSRTFSG